MQVTLFVWLNAKIEKISTKDKFENYGFFCTILYNFKFWKSALSQKLGGKYALD